MKARARSVGQLANQPTPTSSGPGRALAGGAQVLDLVTGTCGTITTAAAEHIVNAAGTAKRIHSFTVRLVDGSTVTRTGKQLAALPAGVVHELVFPPPAES
jgi:hypothetical protein